MNIYQLELAIRNLKKDCNLNFNNYEKEIKEAIKSFNDFSENTIDLESLKISKDRIYFNVKLMEETNRPLKKISYFSKKANPFLGKYSSVENKLFKLVYFKDISNLNEQILVESNLANKKLEIIELLMKIEKIEKIDKIISFLVNEVWATSGNEFPTEG